MEGGGGGGGNVTNISDVTYLTSRLGHKIQGSRSLKLILTVVIGYSINFIDRVREILIIKKTSL